MKEDEENRCTEQQVLPNSPELRPELSRGGRQRALAPQDVGFAHPALRPLSLLPPSRSLPAVPLSLTYNTHTCSEACRRMDAWVHALRQETTRTRPAGSDLLVTVSALQVVTGPCHTPVMAELPSKHTPTGQVQISGRCLFWIRLLV